MNVVPKKLYLHVGLPKTGTTALQKWFRQHQDDLSLAGIQYPDQFGHNGDKHSFMIDELRNNSKIPRINKIVTNANCSTLFLSNEGLSNHLYDFDPIALKNFRELTKDMVITIILVTRPKEAWLRSYHKQCVLNPNIGASDLWGTSLRASELVDHPRIKRLLNYERLLDDMKTEYGAHSTFHIRYNEPYWFELILDELGVGHLSTHPLTSINVSLPDWAIEMMRQVNSYISSNQGRLAWKRVLQEFLKTNHTIMTASNQEEPQTSVFGIDTSVLKRIAVYETNTSPSSINSLHREFTRFVYFVLSSSTALSEENH